jgi:hypothetical protein
MCRCESKDTKEYEQEKVESIQLYSFGADRATELSEKSREVLRDRLTAAAATGKGQSAEVSDEQVFTQFHIIADGDLLASSGTATDTAGDVVLHGSIAGIPYELHVNVALDLQDRVVTLTLELTKPIHLGPFVWRFKLGGVILNAQGEIIGATSLTPDFDLNTSNVPAESVALFGLSWWCVLKCGGLTFLPILLSCLPAIFSGGPAAFIACVVAKLGQGAAGVAACVAQKCVK